jgi:hypothetical protein
MGHDPEQSGRCACDHRGGRERNFEARRGRRRLSRGTEGKDPRPRAARLGNEHRQSGCHPAAGLYFDIAHQLGAVLFWGGIAVFVCSILIAFAVIKGESTCGIGAYFVMCAIVILFCGGAAWYFWPMRGSAATKFPDVTLRFVYPTSPSLMLDNISDVTAKQIKWTVALWNLDNPMVYSDPSNKNDHEPLQIPISTFDFIRPLLSGGPLNLFGSNLVAPYIKKGDRLVGSASVVCPECERGHTFTVYIEYGKGGWYCEITNEQSGNVLIPTKIKLDDINQYVDTVFMNSPENKRVEIKPRF